VTVHPEVFDAALALPLDERGELARKLIESLDVPFDDPEDVEAEWNAEIERRLAGIDSGQTVLLAADEVRTRLKR
jgi:putative addiction module component (TIGR02574 family)